MARFDEIELDGLSQMGAGEADTAGVEEIAFASRLRRLLTLLTDLSLFGALGFALSPLLPTAAGVIPVASLAAFVVMVSYYYFVGCWMLWGKTIGGTIFDVRVVGTDHPSVALSKASRRWVALCLSLMTAGLGFLMAALPSRLSLPDRLSGTRCVAS